MREHLPPFPAVRAFEAAARHPSFRKAADELHVTHSAVSHQVRHLEEFLGCSLFTRRPQGVTLTDTGARYLDGLSAVLDALARCTADARDTAVAGPLRVCATPAFAARWLAPRIGDFCHEHPGIALQVSTGIEEPDFASGEVDFVIAFGCGRKTGVRFEPLLSSSRSPVLAPALLREGPPLREPKDLRRYTLLRDAQGDQWATWFEQAAGGATTPADGPVFEHCELTLRAAESGQGVALASMALVGRELASGTLVRPFAFATAPVLLYSMVYPLRSADEPRMVAFREWLRERVAADGIAAPARAVSAR